jgi:transcriptional regulator with PAS, ATPase and Fis domain
LQLNDSHIGSSTLEQLTGIRLGQFPPGRVWRLQTSSASQALFARLETRHRLIVSTSVRAPTPGPTHPVAPRELTLDPRLGEAHARARRVQDQGISVLVQGESGTGKEVFAHMLHAEGARSHKPFVAVNCAALPDTLIEAELFGYVGGAFTGARREGSLGRIREAEGGTLFLDEIGDMPLPLQARLLRVLQDKVVIPLGGSKPQPVDFVLVCATHQNLRDAIRSGEFREDLYYRLNGLTVTLPALRERQDFQPLLRSILDQIAHDMARAPVNTIHPGLLTALSTYHWPGNLRQLHGLLRTTCALLDPGETAIDWHHLPEDMALDLRGANPDQALARDALPASASMTSDANLRRLSSVAIQQVVQATQGNMSEAARRLGISRNTLYRRLKQKK